MLLGQEKKSLLKTGRLAQVGSPAGVGGKKNFQLLRPLGENKPAGISKQASVDNHPLLLSLGGTRAKPIRLRRMSLRRAGLNPRAVEPVVPLKKRGA